MKQAILSTAYFAPIQYYTKFLIYNQLFIEQYDSYQKQTYRNRCRILGANGPLDLTIPVLKRSNEKTLVRDIEIDYTTAWQNNHWRTIEAAYHSSPFFEYFEVDFKPFYEKNIKYLIDFNMGLHHIIADVLDLNKEIKLTEQYVKNFEGHDYRSTITPKIKSLVNDNLFLACPYTQTFAYKYNFEANLSILDLLFNTGSEAELILDKSIVAKPIVNS